MRSLSPCPVRILVLLLIAASCSSSKSTGDASSDGALSNADATVDVHPSGSLDSAAIADSPLAQASDAVGLEALAATDSSVRADGEALVTGDARITTDAGARKADAAPGVCGSFCPEECFRATTCVTVCGGPVTQCGCCGCAAGSVDTYDCP